MDFVQRSSSIFRFVATNVYSVIFVITSCTKMVLNNTLKCTASVSRGVLIEFKFINGFTVSVRFRRKTRYFKDVWVFFLSWAEPSQIYVLLGLTNRNITIDELVRGAIRNYYAYGFVPLLSYTDNGYHLAVVHVVRRSRSCCFDIFVIR